MDFTLNETMYLFNRIALCASNIEGLMLNVLRIPCIASSNVDGSFLSSLTLRQNKIPDLELK